MAPESDVKAIRYWLLRKPQLPQTLEDHFLDNFLFCCGGSLERTKTSLELFFTYRTDCPEIFRDRDPLKPEIQHIFNITELCPLPQLTPEGYGCLLFRFADPDPDKFEFYDFVKTFFMVGDVRARFETELVKGLVPILDMTGWSLKHITKASIFSVRKYIKYCQEAQPVKLKQIHVINAVPLFDKLFTFIKPFVKSEIISVVHSTVMVTLVTGGRRSTRPQAELARGRGLAREASRGVHVHPVGSEKLYEFIPKAILPSEYGGSAGTMDEIKESYKKKVEAERDWFLKDEWMINENVSPELEDSFKPLAFC